MLIDLTEARKALKNKEVEQKIEIYSKKIRLALEIIDEILDDVEESEIDWFKVDPDHQAKIEAISRTALFMETYVGWTRE
jgi:hypothetical protein